MLRASSSGQLQGSINVSNTKLVVNELADAAAHTDSTVHQTEPQPRRGEVDTKPVSPQDGGKLVSSKGVTLGTSTNHTPGTVSQHRQTLVFCALFLLFLFGFCCL